jgi:hypothetical protein
MKYPGMHLKSRNEIPWDTFENTLAYISKVAMKYPGLHLKIPWHTFEKLQ